MRSLLLLMTTPAMIKVMRKTVDVAAAELDADAVQPPASSPEFYFVTPIPLF
jgi:hypothetical protein